MFQVADYHVPSNGHEFAKEWRRNCKTSTEKYDYLLKIGAKNLGVIFKAEVGFGLLGDFLAVFDELIEDSKAPEILAILWELSNTNRFELNRSFLSGREQEICTSLITKIIKACSEESDLKVIEDVKKRFCYTR